MHFVADAIASASRLRFGHGTSPNDWKSTESKAVSPLRKRQYLVPRKDNFTAAQYQPEFRRKVHLPSTLSLPDLGRFRREPSISRSS